MNNLYISQPVLSSAEIAAFLRKAGLDFSAWPQSKLPTECIETEISEETDWLRKDPDDSVAPEDIARISAEANTPHAILRTSWGLIVAERYLSEPEDEDEHFGSYNVEVHYAKGWGNEAIGAYSDACVELLERSLNVFRKKNRGNCPDLNDGSGEAVLELSTSFDIKDGKKAEEEARDCMLKYLIEIFENGTLDKVIEVGCADNLEEGAAAGLMLGMRPDLHERVG